MGWAPELLENFCLRYAPTFSAALVTQKHVRILRDKREKLKFDGR